MIAKELNIKKVLISERKSIEAVEPLLQMIKKKLALKDEFFYNMLIAVTEAVNNAIIHGNKCNPEKKVTIDISTTDDNITIVISDEGKGFNPNEIADPRAPENLLKDNGRGIFLIRELTETADFKVSEEGAKITMVFKLS